MRKTYDRNVKIIFPKTIKKINEEFLKRRLQNILKSSQELVNENISINDYAKSKE